MKGKKSVARFISIVIASAILTYSVGIFITVYRESNNGLAKYFSEDTKRQAQVITSEMYDEFSNLRNTANWFKDNYEMHTQHQ